MNALNQPRSFKALKSLLSEKETKGYKIKEVTGKGDVMGDLVGYQFDSDERGGYVYFWSSGVVGRQLLEYTTGEETIRDAIGRMDDNEVDELIALLGEKL